MVAYSFKKQFAEPILAFSGWYTARRQDEILADRLAAIRPDNTSGRVLGFVGSQEECPKGDFDGKCHPPLRRHIPDDFLHPRFMKC